MIFGSRMLNKQALDEIRSENHIVVLNSIHCTELIVHLKAFAKDNSIFRKFQSPFVEEELCIKTTSLKAIEFLEIYNSLLSMKNSSKRTKSQALAIYLFWLKTGLSQTLISTYFGGGLTQIDISHFNQQVRDSLSLHFVPKYIGSQAINRDQLIGRNSPFINKFCETPFPHNKIAAVLADATYLEIGKSTNHAFQRLTYSCQKLYNLLKPFLICAPDGYIVDIYGPYPATWNDAKILIDLLEDESDLRALLNEGDYWILDRGFRDSIDTLETTYKFRTMMPCFLEASQKQFTTEQANQSRLVTKSRWVVEAVFGVIKKSYRALDGKLENKSLLHTKKDFRIAGILISYYIKICCSEIRNKTKISRFIESEKSEF